MIEIGEHVHGLQGHENDNPDLDAFSVGGNDQTAMNVLLSGIGGLCLFCPYRAVPFFG